MGIKNIAAAILTTPIELRLSVSDGSRYPFLQNGIWHKRNLSYGGVRWCLVIKFSVDHARFWISSEGNSADKVPISGGSIRKILTITDPDNHIAQAVNAGAMVVSRWAKGMAGDWAGRQIRLAITARLAAHSVNNRKATRLILY